MKDYREKELGRGRREVKGAGGKVGENSALVLGIDAIGLAKLLVKCELSFTR